MTHLNYKEESLDIEKRDWILAVFKDRSLINSTKMKSYLANRLSKHEPVQDRKKSITYFMSNYKAHVDETIKVAEEVSKKEFLFKSPWDMEKTQEPYCFEGAIDWTFTPNGDPEWCYMLNRHHYFISLGQAYLLTEDEKYAKVFVDQIVDWIKTNPYSETLGTKSWRTIEMGIRCEHWLKALRYFINSECLTDDVLFMILKSLYEHGMRLLNHFTDFSETSNWGIIENKGLYSLGAVFDMFKSSKYWRETAESRLVKCVAVQVYDDGLHWEQSSLYHCEVLMSLMTVKRLADRYGYDVSDEITDTIYRMARATMYQSTPLGNTPLNGDSDMIDCSDLLSEVSLLLNEAQFKLDNNKHFGYENAWEYGIKGIEYYSLISNKRPTHRSYGFVNAHQYVMRSDWHKEALYLMFSAGSLGGGHGHCDLLHFELSAYGEHFLVDGGRYSYMNDSKWRKQLKSAWGHNTIIIDGIDQHKYIDSWSSRDNARGKGQTWLSHETYDYVEASHDGYRMLKDPVSPTRKILFVKPHYWIVMDQIECNGNHDVERRFQFSCKDLVLDFDTYCLKTTNTSKANLEMITPIGYKRGKWQVETTHYSPEYNLLKENSTAINTENINGFTSYLNVLYPRKKHMGNLTVEKIEVRDRMHQLVQDYYAEAIKIQFEETGYVHVILIVHHTPDSGIDAFRVDGSLVYGDIVLIKREDGQQEVIRIR